MPTEQPIPPSARCPECGGEPSRASHNLSALGYIHDDRQCVCSECGERWTLGIPVGRASQYMWRDLTCNSCSYVEPTSLVRRIKHSIHRRLDTDCECLSPTFGRVHRITQNSDKNVVGLTLKCPECYYVWSVSRVQGETGQAIAGWPMTTGEIGDGHGWTIDGKIRPSEVDMKTEVQESASMTVSIDEIEKHRTQDHK